MTRETPTLHASLVDAQFAAAERLYQVGALDLAAERLESLARQCPNDEIKATALGRLAEIAADQCDVARSERALRDARRFVGLAPGDLSAQEVALAETRLALALSDPARLRRALAIFEPEPPASAPDRAWLLRGQAWRLAAICSVYVTLQIDLARAYAQRAAESLGRASTVPPRVLAALLTARSTIDFHDVERVRYIDEECAQAYALGIEHGMTNASADALFDALIFRLYSGGASATTMLATNGAGEALRSVIRFGDPALAAAAATYLGEYDTALSKLRLTDAMHREGLIDGTVPVTGFHAQILYLAGRYADALQASQQAVRNWKELGLPFEGTALRIQAEALEALGERDAGRRVIGDAIAALEPISAVPHLLAAYRCAHRLTGDSRFAKRAAWLVESIRPRGPGRKSAQLTPRERQVVELVIAGRSNPQIGHALGISPRTVATHVESVLRRLDLRARWQIEAKHIRAGQPHLGAVSN